MQHPVGSAIRYLIHLEDAAGDPITGKDESDFAIARAFLLSTPATTAAVTITETAAANSEYVVAFTPSVVGDWGLHIRYAVSPLLRRWIETFRVITAAQDDPAATLSGAEMTTISSVDATTAAVSIYQSDTYDADESRSLDWTTSSADTWPTLTGASIAFVARHTTQTSRTISASGSVTTATGASKSVRVELTAADTASKPHGTYDYQVIATLTNNHVITLAAGTLTLTERIRA